MICGDELLHRNVDTMRMSGPINRVAYERDEGQTYSIGARVDLHPMDTVYRMLQPRPADGQYSVTRCERIRDTGWQALRVSLQLVDQPGASAPGSMRDPGSTTGADDRS